MFYILAFCCPAVAMFVVAFVCPLLETPWLVSVARITSLILGGLGALVCVRLSHAAGQR